MEPETRDEGAWQRAVTESARVFRSATFGVAVALVELVAVPVAVLFTADPDTSTQAQVGVPVLTGAVALVLALLTVLVGCVCNHLAGNAPTRTNSLLVSFAVEFPGPFEHHDVVVDGWKVPLLKANLVGEERVDLLLDDRFALEVSTDEAERLVPFLADAIAVALGFGSHPQRDTEPPLERLPSVRPQRVTELLSVDS